MKFCKKFVQVMYEIVLMRKQ